MDEEVIEIGLNGKPLTFACMVCEKIAFEDFAKIPNDPQDTPEWNAQARAYYIMELRRTALKLPFTVKLCATHDRKLEKFLETLPMEDMEVPIYTSFDSKKERQAGCDDE